MDKKKVTHLVTRRLLPGAGLVGFGLVLANLATVGTFMTGAYHYVRNTPRTGAIQINIFDGTRRPFTTTQDVLVRVIDGNQKEVLVRYFKANSIKVENLDFHDNFGDLYTVIVWSDGYKQAGFHPVKLRRGETVSVDLMLMPKNHRINFDAASWDQLKLRLPALQAMMASGLSDQEARERWEKLVKDKPLVAAHLLNVAGALSNVRLPTGEAVMPFFKQVVFDSTLKQDNFFAYADKRLVAELKKAVAQRKGFEYAAGSQVFHPGNTASFKEISFWEANVQISVYEQDIKLIDGVEAVRVETDIDYYRDPAAHVILEVIPNNTAGKMTDPMQVYQLRWIAARSTPTGPIFDPLYIVEKTK